MAFHACRQCGGSGYYGLGRAWEDSGICCDGGGTYTCDECGADCEDEVHEGHEHEHLCTDCKEVGDAQDAIYELAVEVIDEINSKDLDKIVLAMAAKDNYKDLMKVLTVEKRNEAIEWEIT